MSSSDPYAAGQFPIAAVDGASATRWQPMSNESSSITINTTTIPAQLVKGLFFDWGSRPPRNVTVYLGNTTTPSSSSNSSSRYSENENITLTGKEIIIRIDGITPSLPYNAKEAEGSEQKVEPVVGNSTTVDVEGGAWSGDFVRVVVEGCWEDDGAGATVGEVVVIGAGGG